MRGSRRSRRGPLIALLVSLAAAAAVVAAIRSGRLPALKQTWGTVASAVGSVASAVGSAVAPPEDAGLPSAAPDSGATLDSGMPLRQSGPLSKAQLGAPLVHGAFVTACGAPNDMKVVVKADVRYGRAVNVTVKTTPPNLMVSSCIERATRDLQWDVSPKMGHVTVRY
jgi:hypothetical protein